LTIESAWLDLAVGIISDDDGLEQAASSPVAAMANGIWRSIGIADPL